MPPARRCDIYEYRAQLLGVHDGDTITVMLDKGLKGYQGTHIRLNGMNAPELATAAGKAALAHLLALIGPTTALVIRTIKDAPDKYGDRWGGKVWLESDGTWGDDNQFVTSAPSANDWLVLAGFAVHRIY